MAALEEHVEVVKILLEKGANVNALDKVSVIYYLKQGKRTNNELMW